MRKNAIIICSLACITLVAAAMLYPRYRQEQMKERLTKEALAKQEAARLEQEKLLALLNNALTAQTKAEAMKKIVIAGAGSGNERLIDYAQNDPLVAFDPKHSVAFVIDDSSGEMFVVTTVVGVSKSYRPPFLFQEVQLLRSDEQQVDFVFKVDSIDSDVEYHWRTVFVNGGLFNKFSNNGVVSPDEISLWKSQKLWPF